MAEDDTRDLRERLLALEVKTRIDRQWLLVVGTIFAVLLGYTNLISVPGQVEDKAAKAAQAEVEKKMPKAAQDAIEEWVKEKSGSAIIDGLRRVQESAEDSARAASEQAEIARRTAEQIGEIRKRYDEGRDLGAMPIDCSSDTSIFDRVDATFAEDLFSCEVDFPVAGILYLSLQGHIRNLQQDKPCKFSIFVNGNNINNAGRQFPSLTYTETWHPAFMSEAVWVEPGGVKLSVRPFGGNCSIHDPDINGIFIPKEI